MEKNNFSNDNNNNNNNNMMIMDNNILYMKNKYWLEFWSGFKAQNNFKTQYSCHKIMELFKKYYN